MSLNQSFDEYMDDAISSLVGSADVNNTTIHAVLNIPEANYPNGITQESLGVHVNFINNASVQATAATAQLARTAHEADNSITSFDSTLNLGAFTVNTQHILKQDLGDTSLYGQSTTAVDYQFSEDLNAYQDQMTNSNAELAAKYFG